MLMESQSGANLPGDGLTVPTSAVVAAYGVGMVVTLIAALLPAVRASKTPPIAAMRDAATPDKPLTVLTIAGALVTATGAAGVAAALFDIPTDLGDWMLPALLGGVLLVFVGVALLTPALSRPVISVLGRAFAWSVPGQLGRQNSARNPRRTAITAAALMVGIALVTGVSVVASSLTASIEGMVTRDLGAELVISGPSSGRIAATFDPAVMDQVSDVPGVARAVAVRTDVAQLTDGPTPVVAADLPALAQLFRLTRTDGDLRELRAGEVAVDADFAADHGLAVGSTTRFTTPRGGAEDLTVVGIYERSELLPGPVLSVADATAGFRSAGATTGYIALADGADPTAVRQQVSTLIAGEPEVSVQDQSDFADQQTSQVDTVVLLLYLLLGLAVVIAVLGIVNTLALSIVERTRELGLVRAIGMRRGQVRLMVVVESVVIAVFGALLGLGVGSGLGTAVVRALNDQGIPDLSLPWASLGTFLVLAVLIGLLAAVIPAIRASRTNVLDAIAYE